MSQTVDSIALIQVDSLIKVSLDYTRKHDFKNAIQANLSAENIAIENFGKESDSYAKVCQYFGVIYYHQGNYEAAEQKYIESISIRERVLGLHHPDLAASINSLGVLYLMVGDFDTAEPLLLKSWGMREKTLGKKHADYAASLNNLAMLYNKLGQFKKSELYYIESKNIRNEIFGNMHTEYASSLNNLAILYLDLGNYKLAEPLYLEAKTIRKKLLGENHPEYATTLNNLGVLYWKMGNYEAAMKYYLESIAIYKKVFGEHHPRYSKSLNNLAILYNEMNDFERAEMLYLESLQILEKTSGKDDLNYAWGANNLAMNYKNRGEFEKAMPLLLEAKLIWEKVYGRDHPDYATSLRNLADLYCKIKDFNKAEPLYLEALTLQSLSLGNEHPDYANSLATLADYYYAIGNINKAKPYLLKSVEVEKRYIRQAAQHLSELEMTKYINKFVSGQNGCFTYAQKFHQLTDVCFDNTLFYKGFLLNAVSQMNSIVMRDSLSRDKFELLKSYHRRLASEYLLPIQERDSISIIRLQDKANLLEKEIIRSVTGLSEVLQQLEWKDVRKKLKLQEAAIEFVQYEFCSDSLMYAALIIKPDSEFPNFIALFEEQQLNKILSQEKNISSKVNVLYASRGAIPVSEKNMISKKLFELLWHPLEKELKNTKTIYFSPSGKLNQLNIGAIPIQENETIADRYQLVQLTSTRQLVIPTKFIKSNNKAVLFGGIQFEQDSTFNNNESLLGSRSRDELTFSSIDSTLRGGTWNYLAGTEREVNAIEKIMQTSDMLVHLNKGYQATEESFKNIVANNVSSPRILHIATHGYFFPDPKVKVGSSQLASRESGGSQESVFKMSDHPMLRSGLILAGGNAAWQGKPTLEGREDGILTAYEISQMNLSNTELVVLSACETGLGDIQGNEGVYGLQRAFKIAGAKYLIMSLWQVPDKQTSLLMTTFYKKWLEEKMTIPNAFHAAQKELRDIGLDPYQWAGFVLVE
ncbi:MAG: CHAT domain-containing protein [Saprospiraceae bacterium]|nr:CHAT domain-containing protein [Saprospiraceae bacterium]